MTGTEPKRGRGRPAKDPADVREAVRLRLPVDTLARLRAKAEAEGLNTTEAIEAAVDRWLEVR